MSDTGDRPPASLGRYELLEELGRGRTSVVYRAHDPLLGRTMALKAVRVPPGVSEPERLAFEDRFFTEARIAARLSHPGIVVVHDVGRDEQPGRLFMTLELLEGRTLSDLTAGGEPLGWRDALSIVARLADALHHAHARGVIHRGLGPGSIMVLRSGEPKIMDFGMARIRTAQLTMTAAGGFPGAPAYASPEQVAGQAVDAASDVFQLGAVAYRLLTGRDAFAAAHPAQILFRVAHEDPPLPSSVVPTVPPEVDDLVKLALAKSPLGRYRDAKSLGEDVEDVLNGQPPRHCPRLAPLIAPRGEGDTGSTEATLRDPASGPTPEAAPTEAPSSRTGMWLADLTQLGGPPQSDPTRVGRRAALRATAGLAALGLVVLLEIVLRDDGNTPPGVLPPSSARPAPTTPEQQPAVPSDALSSASDALSPDATARLAIDFEHSLKNGRLRVFVDDQKVLEQALAGAVKKKALILKSRRGIVRRSLAVSPGDHRVRVQVLWEDEERSQLIAGTFRAGATHRLAMRLGGISKGLSLEWR